MFSSMELPTAVSRVASGQSQVESESHRRKDFQTTNHSEPKKVAAFLSAVDS